MGGANSKEKLPNVNGDVDSKEKLSTVYNEVLCPKCLDADKSKVTTTIFGHGAFIRVCSVCGWSVGVDDSANLCDLGTEGWVFEVTGDGVDRSCLKNQRHVPRFIGLNSESLMQSICVNCLKTGIMFSVDGERSGASAKDAPVCDINETLRIIFETNLEEDSAAHVNNPISDEIQDEIASVVDKTSGDLIAILLNTDLTEQINSSMACQCGREGYPVDRADLFGRTPEASASESSEREVNPGLNSEEKTAVKTCVRVTDLRQLKPGDHIAWHRWYAVWHHAIVVYAYVNIQEITVIHNSGGLRNNPNGKIASVREEIVKVDCKREYLYVYQYSEGECYPPEEVIDRAIERLDETYNPFKYNCEHFARWCKTGLKCCLQMKGFRRRLKMGSPALVRLVEEWLIVALRVVGNSERMKEILATGAKGAREAIRAQLSEAAGSTKLFCGLGIGTMVVSIALSVATELIFFTCKLYKAKKEVDREEMPWDVFQRFFVQLIFEGLFGLGEGLAADFGVAMIPYAGIFLSPLGYLLGNWIGRLLGAIVGKVVARKLPFKKPAVRVS